MNESDPMPSQGKDQAPTPSGDPSGPCATPSGRQLAFQTIPETYKQAGYFMKLLKREGNAAMYADASGTYFEVHKVQLRKAERAFGKQYPDREALASNEEFGTYGWACVNLERADFRFANIVADSKS